MTDVELFFKEEVVIQNKTQLEEQGLYYKTLDNSHGRFEKREYFVCNDIEWLSQKADWIGLEGIGLCISSRTRVICSRLTFFSLRVC